MTYTPNTPWVDGSGGGTPLAAARLNNTEAGVAKGIDDAAAAQATADAAAPAVAVPIHFAAAAALVGVSPTDRCYVARTLTGARMRTASAPAGAALTVQVQHWDGSTWTTIGTLTIADASTVEAVIAFTQAQVVGDMLRLNVTSVGSTTAATGVVVDVLWS